MSLNYKEIDLILDELNLQGSFIQQIVQPTFDSIAINTYKTGDAKTILICLAPGACRIHETRKAIPKNEKPLRFMQFLRSKIKGSRIDGIFQIEGERIVQMNLSHGEEKFHMFLRLWTNAANIIVTKTEKSELEKDAEGAFVKEPILDVFYRRPKRNEITGGFYAPEIREQKSTKEFVVRTFDEIANGQNLSFNQKVEIWYGEHAETLSRTALLEQAEKIYNSRKSRIEAAICRLEEKRESFLQADKWKHSGDLILTYGYLVEAAIAENKSFIECIDYETDQTIKIQINPKQRAQENAQNYYEKYKKAVSGLEELEYDIKATKSELAKLTSDYESLLNEKNPIAIQQKMRKQNKPKQQIEKKHPGLDFDINGWKIFVGRTASENDELLRRHVKGHDWWLHTRDWPGGYVFIKNQPGKSVPLEVLLDAGNLALFYSKGRKAGKGDLYYTQVKYLRRAKNAPKGTVLPSNEKNLFVTLDDKRLKKIEMMQKDGNILV